jgi:hypothetical protein
VGPRIQFQYSMKERGSLLSIDMRLNWCEWTKAQGGVDSPRGFRVAARRRSLGLSSM